MLSKTVFGVICAKPSILKPENGVSLNYRKDVWLDIGSVSKEDAKYVKVVTL